MTAGPGLRQGPLHEEHLQTHHGPRYQREMTAGPGLRQGPLHEEHLQTHHGPRYQREMTAGPGLRQGPLHEEHLQTHHGPRYQREMTAGPGLRQGPLHEEHLQTHHGHRYQREMTAGPGFVTCNSYTMATAIDDGFMWVSEPVVVTVELQGTYTRGMMVLDKLGVLEKEHQVVIMRTVDLESFKGMLMDSLK
ncbi:zinc finger protein 358-like [Oncorhynchus kisutch]|uniref:zinc finger protein 358-like n=1 Tax=Oncorhynchus kisutch TaxID=8019 RepID=UPI0012DEA673|nr:zinc finger protein 358-like [Oncorhynchus kisutch]